MEINCRASGAQGLRGYGVLLVDPDGSNMGVEKPQMAGNN